MHNLVQPKRLVMTTLAAAVAAIIGFAFATVLPLLSATLRRRLAASALAASVHWQPVGVDTVSPPQCLRYDDHSAALEVRQVV